MSNMSYCKFQNTQADLLDCANHLTGKLSSEEHQARMRMLSLMATMLEDAGYNVDRPNPDELAKYAREWQAKEEAED